jgi:hypothetical protein
LTVTVNVVCHCHCLPLSVFYLGEKHRWISPLQYCDRNRLQPRRLTKDDQPRTPEDDDCDCSCYSSLHGA